MSGLGYRFRNGVQATLWGMKAIFPHIKDRGGKIINSLRKFGMTGFEGAAACNGNNEAIRGLSRTAAREWGRYGINVKVITPLMRTDAQRTDPVGMKAMIQSVPMRRLGDPLRDAGWLPYSCPQNPLIRRA